jgi:hypothetical protein
VGNIGRPVPPVPTPVLELPLVRFELPVMPVWAVPPKPPKPPVLLRPEARDKKLYMAGWSVELKLARAEPSPPALP